MSCCRGCLFHDRDVWKPSMNMDMLPWQKVSMLSSSLLMLEDGDMVVACSASVCSNTSHSTLHRASDKVRWRLPRKVRCQNDVQLGILQTQGTFSFCDYFLVEIESSWNAQSGKVSNATGVDERCMSQRKPQRDLSWCEKVLRLAFARRFAIRVEVRDP